MRFTNRHGPAEQFARRAQAAQGEHEQRLGKRDANWADWYAAYMVAEQSGKERL
jgi:hypothetical protein